MSPAQNRKIYMAKDDAERLKTLIETDDGADDSQTVEMRKLETELDQNDLIISNEIPPDVVTIKSTVQVLDLDTQEERTWTLVFPEQADIERNKISVLAPVGMAMLGRSVGDTFEWTVPAGVLRLQIKDVAV